ncbi:polyprenal reductase-like isoform X2 [Babylonia areolata]
MEAGMLSVFWLVTSAVLILSYFIDQHPSCPNVWRSLLRWGKMRVGVVAGSDYFYEVPKRWFRHFYVLGTVVTSSVVVVVWGVVYGGQQWPVGLAGLIDWLQYPAGDTGLTDVVPVLLTLTLEVAQVVRRSYETFFVNVFSRGASMTLLHYLLGFVFYLSIGPCVLTGTDFRHLRAPDAIDAMDGMVYLTAVVIFLSASVVQHQSFRTLAALRMAGKDQGSKPRSTYPLPSGGLFELVSCPHFLAEILIYFSFCVVFRFCNVALLSLFIFVLVNQVLAALLNHQWYCRHFPVVRETRCAVFPYLL